jgi:hypothetical protein
MKKNVILSFFFLLSACELIVDIDVPFDGSQLTVNSFFTPDSLWSATVTLNRHILDKDPINRVENALLVVYEDTTPIDTLDYKGEGKYRSDNGTPENGKQYSIRCEAPGYAPVEGRSVTPLPAPLHEVTTETISVAHQSNTRIRIKFHDDVAVSNYYQISVAALYENFSQNGTIHEYWSEVRIEPTDAELYSQYIQLHNTLLFKDILFNGKETELVLKLAYPLFHAGGLMVTLRTLSEDYYKYKNTVGIQEETTGNPFAQPVNVYKNIENGFGIFAGYSRAIYQQVNPKPVIHSVSPLQGKPGDVITITGENLMTESDYRTEIQFAGQGYVFGQIVEIDNTHIRVTIPKDALTGKILLTANGRRAFSEEEIEIED